ncbi:hypothetical protein ACFLWO_04005, partial [Chloroflexota bacterium]
AKKGEGISVVMFACESRENAIEHLKSRGVRAIRPSIFHPKDTHGVMIEVCEFPLSQMWERGVQI